MNKWKRSAKGLSKDQINKMDTKIFTHKMRRNSARLKAIRTKLSLAGKKLVELILLEHSEITFKQILFQIDTLI